MKTISIPSIIHVSESNKTGIERRQISVVHGVCMYQSTGNNSGLAGTWFPFLGINNQEHPYPSRHDVEGYFFKPIYAFAASHRIEDGYPREAYAKMSEVFQKQTRNMAARFGSLYNMLVSSQFGGGLWDTKEGKTFKNWLEQSYSNFYQNFPKLQAEGGPETSNGIEVNQWMRHQGGNFKKIPLETKQFKAPLQASDIIGKRKKGVGDYVISWLKFVPELAKRVIAELPSIKLPSLTTKQAKQDTRKSVILIPAVPTSRKMAADKENSISPDDDTKRKKKRAGPN